VSVEGGKRKAEGEHGRPSEANVSSTIQIVGGKGCVRYYYSLARACKYMYFIDFNIYS
jgi:hypothetical protein